MRDVFEERRKRGSLTRLELQKRMDRLSPTLDYTGFRRADLVIEAVFEDLELKRKVLAEMEAAVGEGLRLREQHVVAPDRRDRAPARTRPGRVLGMHFFSPVHKMPLLEVIVTPETDAAATATAVTFGRRLGKHVIVVRDGPGFYTTRTLAPYMNEAARLVEEGARGRGGRPGDDRLRLPGGAGGAARRGGHRRGGQGREGPAPALRGSHDAARRRWRR